MRNSVELSPVSQARSVLVLGAPLLWLMPVLSDDSERFDGNNVDVVSLTSQLTGRLPTG